MGRRKSGTHRAGKLLGSTTVHPVALSLTEAFCHTFMWLVSQHILSHLENQTGLKRKPQPMASAPVVLSASAVMALGGLAPDLLTRKGKMPADMAVR